MLFIFSATLGRKCLVMGFSYVLYNLLEDKICRYWGQPTFTQFMLQELCASATENIFSIIVKCIKGCHVEDFITLMC